MELCKRKRLDENTLTLSKGKVERKEGEKRRTPAFRRGVRQKGKMGLRQTKLNLSLSFLDSQKKKTEIRKSIYGNTMP